MHSNPHAIGSAECRHFLSENRPMKGPMANKEGRRGPDASGSGPRYLLFGLPPEGQAGIANDDRGILANIFAAR